MNNPAIDQYRYMLEHHLIPHYLFESDKTFITLLLQMQGKLFVDLYEAIQQDAQSAQACPYTPEEFKITPMLINGHGSPETPDFAVIRIDMPMPTFVTECRQIYICHDVQFENPAYFTVERSIDGDFLLCEWSENQEHLNYGTCPQTDKELFHKVMGLYAQRVWPISEESEPS